MFRMKNLRSSEYIEQASTPPFYEGTKPGNACPRRLSLLSHGASYDLGGECYYQAATRRPVRTHQKDFVHRDLKPEVTISPRPS